MNGDQGMMENNAFSNILKKNYHSQGIFFFLICSHFFFCKKNKKQNYSLVKFEK